MLRNYLVNYRCDGDAGRHRKVARPLTARVVVQESLAFNSYAFVAAPRSLFITCLRDPVDRIASLYFFEGRWKQKDYDRTNETAIPFGDWNDKVGNVSLRRAQASTRQRESTGHWPLNIRFWEETADYYTQIFSGVAARPTTKIHYAAALTTLASFDVVLILEALATESGRAQAETLLGRVLPHSPSASCAPRLPSQPVNLGKSRRREAPLDSTERAVIAAANAFDIDLYAAGVAMYLAQVAAAPPAAASCGDAQQLNCTIPTFPGHPSLLAGENILRGCARFFRPCAAGAGAPQTRAAPPPAKAEPTRRRRHRQAPP